MINLTNIKAFAEAKGYDVTERYPATYLNWDGITRRGSYSLEYITARTRNYIEIGVTKKSKVYWFSRLVFDLEDLDRSVYFVNAYSYNTGKASSTQRDRKIVQDLIDFINS